MTKKKLEQLFSQFDNDGSGQITSDIIRIAMSKFGMDIDDAEIKEIMDVHDYDGDGRIVKVTLIYSYILHKTENFNKPFQSSLLSSKNNRETK